MAEQTELQAQQYLIKAIIRCVAVLDLIHLVFPITFFLNLCVFAVVYMFSPRAHINSTEFSVLLTFVPVGIVGMIAFSYGVPLAIKLFNATHPEIRPKKCADMAMWWWFYSIGLSILQKLTAGMYYFLGDENEHFVGEVFNFTTNFSLATRIVCIFIVRKFIRTMRRKDHEVEEAPPPSSRPSEVTIPTQPEMSSRSSVKWELPPTAPEAPVPRRASSVAGVQRTYKSRVKAMRNNLFQMMFLTKVLLIVDLMQNTFMVLTLFYVFLSFAASLIKMAKADDNMGHLLAYLFFFLYALVVYSYATSTGVKFISATDEFADSKMLHELPEPLQKQLTRRIRKWISGCVACVVMLEIICLLLIITFSPIQALIYTASLSFSFAIRVVSLYMVVRFRKNFLGESYEVKDPEAGRGKKKEVKEDAKTVGSRGSKNKVVPESDSKGEVTDRETEVKPEEKGVKEKDGKPEEVQGMAVEDNPRNEPLLVNEEVKKPPEPEASGSLEESKSQKDTRRFSKDVESSEEEEDAMFEKLKQEIFK